MKHAKTYIALACVVLIAFLVKINTWDISYGQVEEFRGATLKQDIFYPMMARSVNDSKELEVVVDNTAYTPTMQDVCLGSDLEPYASEDFLRHQLNIAARCYGLDKMQVICNGREYNYDYSDGCYVANQKLYVPLKKLASDLGATYLWDRDDNRVSIYTSKINSSLPSKFDLRDYHCVSPTKDQGSSTTCWAYAAANAVESSALPNKVNVDVNDIINNKAFNLAPADGGDFTQAIAYFLSWSGPKSLVASALDNSNNEVNLHLQEAEFYTHEDREDIKWAVYKYGGVTTSVYANVAVSDIDKSTYYNKQTSSYYCPKEKSPNHEIVIVGWDDNYPASKFTGSTSGDGAFICQNSWGDGFGDKGIFYVSYYDANIGKQAVSYSRFDTGIYDVNHQTDLCGYAGKVGYSTPHIYGANVYRADSKEIVKAAGFYTLEKNISYNLYIVTDYSKLSDLSKRQLVASGVMERPGYHTVEFDHNYTVAAKDKFAIIIELQGEEFASDKQLAIEYKKGSQRYADVDISDGEGYISEKGERWENIEKKMSGNICLKAYASSVK